MTVDRKPSVQQETPHSRRGMHELLGIDLLNAGGFNEDVVSDGRFLQDGTQVDLHFGKPDDFDDDPRVIIVADKYVMKGAVSFHRWYVGTVLGLDRGRRSSEDADLFDKQVDEFLAAAEEVPYTELRERVMSLIPEDRRWDHLSDYDPAIG